MSENAYSNTFAEKSEQVRGDILILQLEALTLQGLALAVGLIDNALGIESTIPVAVFTVTVWMLLWRSAEIFFLDIRSAYRELRKYRRIASATKQY